MFVSGQTRAFHRVQPPTGIHLTGPDGLHAGAFVPTRARCDLTDDLIVRRSLITINGTGGDYHGRGKPFKCCGLLVTCLACMFVGLALYLLHSSRAN